LEERLIAVGDMVIYLPNNRGAIKNLTVGREYFVEKIYVRDSQYIDGEIVPAPKHVTEVQVTNDKGTIFGYSTKKFKICQEGVVFDLGPAEQAFAKASYQMFMDGLKEL